MVRALLLFILLSAPGAFAADNLRVLFIGNSFTFMNDLPQLTARLAASARPPRTLETKFVGEGGATLKRHWEAGKALEAIRKGKWDYVVLQDQSELGLGLNNPTLFHTYARLFDAEIRKAGAKTVFFLTWARRDSPQDQALLTDAYASIAAELKAIVAPVGVAWQKALAENPKLVLHYSDGSHPGAAGSYLAACVFYTVLYSSSPEGLGPDQLNATDAAFLQRIAWRTAKDPAATKVQQISSAEVRPVETTPATPAALERGRAILAAAQKAAGGLERLRALKDISVVLSGRITTPQGEMAYDGREVFVFPSLQFSEQRFPFGNVVSFFDGTNGWRKTPQGVVDLTDAMKTIVRGQIARNTFNLLRAEGQFTVQFERQDSGADVILITREGESVRLFVEPSSGTLLKKAFRGVGMGGPADMEEIYTDYREVSGVRIPYRVELNQNGAKLLEATVKEVKINTGVDPAELAKKPQ